MSVSSLLMMVRGANLLPIIAWKVSNTLGSFSFLRSNLILVCLGLLILFRRRWKIIISKSWSLSMSAPGKLRVLALFTPDQKRFRSRMYSIWLWCCPFGLCQVMTKNVCQHKIIKGGKLQKYESSHLCHHCRRVHKCLASFHKHPCRLLHSSLLVQQECPSVSNQ